MEIVLKKEFDYNKYINILFVAYAFCVPISKAGVSLFESLIILLWFIQGNWREKYYLYKQSKLLLLLSLFIAWNLISIFWAQSFNEALLYIAKYRHFLIIYIMYSSLDKQYIKHIISGFLFAMLVSEIMSYGIFFELWKYKNISPQDPAPFMDHISYSFYLAITSLLLLFRVFNTKGDFKQLIIYLLFFITVTTNLFINGGRTGQFTFIILCFLLFLLQYENKLKGFVVSMILILGLIAGAYFASPNFNDRINALFVDVDSMYQKDNYQGSLSTRVALFNIGLDKFSDNFFIGSGIGNEMSNIEQYVVQYGYNYEYLKTFSDYHNVFITYGAQLGIIGFLLALAIFYSLFTLAIADKQYKYLSILFTVGYLLWSMTGMTFHGMNPMNLFALFIGLFTALSRSENSMYQ